MKHAAGSAAHQATEQGKSQLAGQKTQAASQLSTVADAVRATGEQLRKQDQGSLAQYAEMGASQIDRFADFLHNKDINELLGEAERYARREPTLFLAGAFALGVVASRFLKSSQRHSDGPQSWNGSGSQGWSGAGSPGWTGPEQTGTGQHYSTPQHYPTPTTTTTGTAGSPTYGTSAEPSGPGLPSRPGTVRS